MEPRLNVGSVAFTPWSFEEASLYFRDTTNLSATVNTRRFGQAVHFANAYTIALADTNRSYRDLLARSDAIFADGLPVVWAANRLYRTLGFRWERVYGPDFMRSVLSHATPSQRHFLLGSTDDVLTSLRHSIGQEFPNAYIVGTYSPPFCENPSLHEIAQRDARIRAASPTHVWVGMGTPKQDYEVVRIAQQHRAFVFGVGAAFDYLSGAQREAPRFVQNLGLQWLHRLLGEPRRLFHRYAWGNPRFLFSVWRGPQSGDSDK